MPRLARALSRHLLLALAAAIAFATPACATTPTQLVVSVGSDLPTDVEPPVEGDRVLRAVRVEVCEPSCDRVDAPRVERRWAVGRADAASGRVALPFSFGVAPHDPDRPERVEIRVEALRDATDDVSDADVLFVTRRVTAFAPGRRLDVSIFLSAGCLGAPCPAGSECDDLGQCVPIEGLDAGSVSSDASLDAASLAPDAGSPDASSIDASTLDAYAPDGVAIDAHTIDAHTIDAGSDAGSIDAGSDASRDASCTLPPTEAPPTALEAERAQGFGGGWVWATEEGAPGVRLASGLYINPTTFTWEGASSTGPTQFLSRVDGASRWTVFPRATTPYDGTNRLSILAEHDGVVYAAGQRNEAWSFTADGETLSLPEPADVETSLETGVVLLALDAATGRPLWGRAIETEGAADFVGGMTVDDDGILLAWRSLTSASSTIGALEVDGVARAIDRGPADGRVRLARLDHDGVVQWVQAIGGASFASVELARTDDGAILALFVSSWLGGATALTGLDPVPPSGSVIVLRLDPLGRSRWATAVRCASGDLTMRSGAISLANGRLYAAISSTTPGTGAECRSLAFGAGDAGDPVLEREEMGPTWLATFGLDVCDGSVAVPRLFSIAANGTPAALIRDVSADARSVAITGYAGSGGFVTPTRTIGGLETGSGTDGFLAIVTPELEERFFLVLGSRSAGSFSDDYGSALGRIDDTLHVAFGLRMAQTIDSISIPAGASLVRFGLR